MASLVDITAFPCIFGSIVQFGGLPFAGMLASLSKSPNTSMKDRFFARHSKLSFALNQLMQAGVVIDRPFLVAARNGHVAAVSAFVAAGAETSPVGNNAATTPLGEAAYMGREKCVELLLGARAAVDLANNNGFTPLNNAAQEGQEKSVALLLDARAAVDLANKRGVTKE